MKKLFTKLCAVIVCVMICIVPMVGCSWFGSSNTTSTSSSNNFVDKYNTVVKYMLDNKYVNLYESVEEEYCYTYDVEDKTFMMTYNPESDQLQLILTNTYYSSDYAYFILVIRPTSNGLYLWGESTDEGNMSGYIDAKTFKTNNASCMKPFEFESVFYEDYEYGYEYEYETMLKFVHSELTILLKGFTQFLSNVNLSIKDFGFIATF